MMAAKLGLVTLLYLAALLFCVANQQWNTDAAESTRLSRVALQKAQQSRELIGRAAERRWIKALSVDQDSHNIAIALELQKLKDLDHVRQLEFQLQPAGQLVTPEQDAVINVTALQLTFLVADAVTALAVLKHFKDSAGVWPTEIRACQLFRHQQAVLSVSCLAHTYHWKINT